jgi:F-type H+-transporting ATPase subunit alpha
MKKVAGTLRLDLAQYREKQAFAQFGSDLDAATRAQLARGERLVEILKQDQYKPMPVEFQVISVLAVNLGFTDKLAVAQIRPFEAALHAHLQANHKDVVDTLRTKREIDKEMEQKLSTIFASFLNQFAAGAIAATNGAVKAAGVGTSGSASQASA